MWLFGALVSCWSGADGWILGLGISKSTERMKHCREVPAEAYTQSSFSRLPESLRPESASAAEGWTPQVQRSLRIREGGKILHVAQNQCIGDLIITRSSLPCATRFSCDLDVAHWPMNHLASFQVPLFSKGHLHHQEAHNLPDLYYHSKNDSVL